MKTQFTSYGCKDEKVRELLDRPRWQEWVEFECQHLNRQMPGDGPVVLYAPEHFHIRGLDDYALEWSYYQDEVLRGGHEMVCLLDRMAQVLPLKHHKYLHRGLTSSNVIDSCNHRRWNDLGGRLDGMYSETIRSYSRIVGKKDQIFPGMTHGRFAYFTTLWHRAEMMDKTGSHVIHLDWDIKGGPTGWQQNHRQCVPRNRYWAFWSWMAEINFNLEQLATDYRFYCSELECGIKMELPNGVATGSSAMPGKRNPSVFERVCSVGFMNRGIITTMMMQPPQWLDRDLVHSALERESIDRLWDQTFWMVEEMGRLLAAATILEYRKQPICNSYDKMNELLDQGMEYTEARRTAASLPAG